MATCRFCGATLSKFWDCPNGCVGLSEEEEWKAEEIREKLTAGSETAKRAVDELRDEEILDLWDIDEDGNLVEIEQDDSDSQDPIGDQEPDKDDYDSLFSRLARQENTPNIGPEEDDLRDYDEPPFDIAQLKRDLLLDEDYPEDEDDPIIGA